MANLALAYGIQSQWKEAEELEIRVMQTSLKMLGEEHPNTMTITHNLALTYGNQGRWKEAEKLQAKELKICSKVLGPKPPSTLISMGNLTSIYGARDDGNLKKPRNLGCK